MSRAACGVKTSLCGMRGLTSRLSLLSQVLTDLVERQELLGVSFGLIVGGNDFLGHPTLKLFPAYLRHGTR